MREEREPRDGPAAGLRDLTQQLDVLVAHRVHAAGVQDHLDGAPAHVVQAAHDPGQLLTAGVAAGQRAALVADVIARGRGGEAEGAGFHGLAEQPPHGGDLVVGGRALEGGLAHHVVAQGREGDEAGDVDTEAAPVDGIEILAVALPLPVDAGLHDVVGDGLDVDEVLHQDLARRRLHRRHAHAAVAHDDRGHAVPRRARHHRVPRDLRVVVRVRIDEARRQHQPLGVDHALGGVAVGTADLADDAVVDAEIAHEAGAAGSVADARVLDQQVEHSCFPFSLDGREVTWRRASGEVEVAGAPASLACRRKPLRARLARAPHPPEGAGLLDSLLVGGSLAEPGAATATTARHDGAPATSTSPDARRHVASRTVSCVA